MSQWCNIYNQSLTHDMYTAVHSQKTVSADFTNTTFGVAEQYIGRVLHVYTRTNLNISMWGTEMIKHRITLNIK